MIEFDYLEEDSRLFGKIFRPVASVQFIDQNEQKLIAYMYIDSGADITLIPRELGETLGFKIAGEEIIEIGGLGDAKVPVIIKTVTMLLDGKKITCRVAWALIEEVPPLLGRTDLFDWFTITFDQKNRKIIFRENDESKGEA